MRTALLSTLCLVLVAGLAPASAKELPDPLDTRLGPAARIDALLGRMRARHDTLATLEAEFVQHKESMMFLEPSVATGVFSYAAPDRVRWEYEAPDPISLLIAGDQMTTWYRDLSRAETTGVGGQSQRILEYMGASTSLDKLLEYFTVALRIPETAAEPFELRLSPRFKRVEKRIRELEISIDSELYLPLRLRFVEGDGDVTEYEFLNLRLNQEIPEDRFVLEIPEQVEVHAVALDAGSPRR